jgi:hypothetical protein
MFETHERARLRTPLFVLEEGLHRWAYVAQTSNHEWFFVTCVTVVDGLSSQQQFLIPDVAFLLGLAAKDTPEMFIQRIQLVSPPWLNHGEGWLMEPIKAIHTLGDGFGYELMNGQMYPSELSGQPGDVVWPMNAAADE